LNDYMVQAIGFIGLFFYIGSYQMRSNKQLYLFQLLGSTFFCIQLCFLGGFTGAMGLSVNILRNLLLFHINEWKWVERRSTLSGILVLLLMLTFCTWAGPISLLPLISVGVTTIGYWTNDAKKIRLSQLFGAPCTMLYDLILHSWGGAINAAITLVSILISIRRFGWHNLEKMVE